MEIILTRPSGRPPLIVKSISLKLLITWKNTSSDLVLQVAPCGSIIIIGTITTLSKIWLNCKAIAANWRWNLIYKKKTVDRRMLTFSWTNLKKTVICLSADEGTTWSPKPVQIFVDLADFCSSRPILEPHLHSVNSLGECIASIY